MTDRPRVEESTPIGGDAHPGLSPILRRGVTVSSVGFVAVELIAIVQLVALARLLSPGEIGAFTAGTALSGLVVTVSQGGLRSALVQRDRDVARASITVFWAALGNGVVTSLAMLAVSPLIATLFGSHVAGIIAAVTAGMPLLHSLTVVPDALLQRGFGFGRRMIVNVSTAISFAIVAVTLAALGLGVWALVAATYASQVTWLGSSWLLAGWWPRHGRPSLRLWRELARYAVPLVVANLAWRLQEILEYFAVARWLGQPTLGQYRYGRRLATLPGLALYEVVGYALFPAFSRIATEPDRFRQAFLRALRWIWCAAVPVAGLMIALGEPAVVVVLGERWRDAGVVLTALAGLSLGQAMAVVANEVIQGSGRSYLMNRMTVAALGSAMVLVAMLMPSFGVAGVGLAISSGGIVLGVTGLWLSRRIVGATIGATLKCLVPTFIAGVFGVAAVAPLEHLVIHSDRRGIVGLAILVGEGTALVGAFLLALRLLAPSTVTAATQAIREVLRRQD